MKKMIATLLGISIVTLFAAGSAAAQTGDKAIAFIPAKNYTACISFVAKNSFDSENDLVAPSGDATKTDANAKTAKANLKATKASNKALKAFNTLYKDVADARWSVQKDALIATFSKEDVQTTVVYQKNGKWFHTLTYYQGDKTPQNVADMTDDAFPRDDIRLTVRVEEGNTTFYIVQLEGKKTLKKVTLYNDEINIIEELTKNN